MPTRQRGGGGSSSSSLLRHRDEVQVLEARLQVEGEQAMVEARSRPRGVLISWRMVGRQGK